MLPYMPYRSPHKPPDWIYALQGVSSLIEAISGGVLDARQDKRSEAEHLENLRQSKGKYAYEFEPRTDVEFGDPDSSINLGPMGEMGLPKIDRYGVLPSRAEERYGQEEQMRALKLAEYGAEEPEPTAGLPSMSELKVLEALGLGGSIQEKYPGYKGLPTDPADIPTAKEQVLADYFGLMGRGEDVAGHPYREHMRESRPTLGGVDAGAILGSTNQEMERELARLPGLLEREATYKDQGSTDAVDEFHASFEAMIPMDQRATYDSLDPLFNAAQREQDWDTMIKIYQRTLDSFEWPALQKWLRLYWGKEFESPKPDAPYDPEAFSGSIIPPDRGY